MRKSDEISARLKAEFAPQHLEVINESERHKGHAGYGDGETHYRIVIKALEFENMSRVARHRAVHAALGADLVGRIHALALEIS